MHILQTEAPATLKLPGAQEIQSIRCVAPAKGLAEPAGQVRQEALPWPGAGLYRPAAHAVQFEAEVAATASKNVPAPHAVHRSDPYSEANMPTLQAEQKNPPAMEDTYPGTHKVQFADPADGATCPGGHNVHLVDPGREA